MTGGFLFKLTSRRVEYEFKINRKITRIVGDSASGKSELIRVLARTKNPKLKTFISCKYRCEVINDSFFSVVKYEISSICQSIKNHNSKNFADTIRSVLARFDNILFFADEDFKDIVTNEFALFCKFTDAFFVLICRDPLYKLPYSYTEIYTIKTSGKFHSLIPLFNSDEFLTFSENRKLIVEDSNAGYTFFSHFYNDVISANGKSKIKRLIETSGVEIIADGAAFGCEMESIVWDILRKGLDVKLFLPESFEYLILTSQLFSDDILGTNVVEPINEISGLYFSWEQYFTELLTMITNGLYNHYSKINLNECYYQPCCCRENQRCNLKFENNKKEAILGKYIH